MADEESHKAEFTTDPAGLGYAGKTDQESADLFNAAVVTVRGEIMIRRFLRWIAKGSRLDAIFAAQSNAGFTPQVRTAARYVMLLVQSVESIDTDDPTDIAAINALVAAGVILAADRAELAAIGNSQVPRGVFLKLSSPKVGSHHVAKARQ